MPALDIPVDPPSEWFVPPEVIPTDKRIVIEASGRVYGYVALWNTCHAGLSGCTRPPKGSPTDYEYAHQGETLTADGSMISTAVIAGGIGHAPLDSETLTVPAYYENTGTQLMRVRYGEDDKGLWFAGSLWPDVNELDVARIRASSVSGDWRWHAAWRHTVAGGFDFAGACFVNIPGFPIPNANGNVGESSGRMRALAASLGAGWIVTDGSDWVASDSQDNDTGETEMCDGGCNCEKNKDLTDEQVDQIVAAMTQIVDRSKRKKALYADGAPIDEEPNPLTELTELVGGIASRLEAIEAAQLADEITAE